MRDSLNAIKPLLAALALLAPLALAAPAPPPAPQNTNSSTTADAKNANVGIPYNRKCHASCVRSYRRCARGGKNSARCRRQLRDCLRRCPQ